MLFCRMLLPELVQCSSKHHRVIAVMLFLNTFSQCPSGASI